MKLLLDENLPERLKRDIGLLHDVRTMREMAWLGKQNGELLRLIVSERFDFLVTMDRDLQHQQPMTRLPIRVILLSAKFNKRESLLPLIPRLLD